MLRLDAAMYDAVDGLQKSNKSMNTTVQSSSELLQRRVPVTTPKKYLWLSFHWEKDRTVPQEKADLFKVLQLLAAVSFKRTFVVVWLKVSRVIE